MHYVGRVLSFVDTIYFEHHTSWSSCFWDCHESQVSDSTKDIFLNFRRINIPVADPIKLFFSRNILIFAVKLACLLLIEKIINKKWPNIMVQNRKILR